MIDNYFILEDGEGSVHSLMYELVAKSFKKVENNSMNNDALEHMYPTVGEVIEYVNMYAESPVSSAEIRNIVNHHKSSFAFNSIGHVCFYYS